MTQTGKTARNRTLEAFSEFLSDEQVVSIKKHLDDPEKVGHLRVLANRMVFLTKKALAAAKADNEQELNHSRAELHALVWLLGEVLE